MEFYFINTDSINTILLYLIHMDYIKLILIFNLILLLRKVDILTSSFMIIYKKIRILKLH